MANKIDILMANSRDREQIYKIRHDVYSRELGQHSENRDKKLKDKLDDFNIYIVGKVDDKVVGFVSLTPPNGSSYSMDKYINREDMPFDYDDGLYEFRVLTVTQNYRNSMLAFVLMYAAFRYTKVNNGTRVMAIGRSDIVNMYLKLGLQSHNREIQSGSVTYQLLSTPLERVDKHFKGFLLKMMDKSSKGINWKLDYPVDDEVHCYHGGAFFEDVGKDFSTLNRCKKVINADVLDAWFDPSPKVIEDIKEYLPWISKTSPPTYCEGLIKTISKERGIPLNTIMPGAGSSELMFRVLPDIISKDSRVLILNPTYGEYGHILEHVIGCQVDYFQLYTEDNYKVNIEELLEISQKSYDLIILVNPNSPTGQFIIRDKMIELLSGVPKTTKIWIDETYIDYVGIEHSMEKFATENDNILICKSMSKVYSLSGMRVAYICSNKNIIDRLKKKMPPWIVGLPSQVAAVAALKDSGYYQKMYSLTHKLREKFIEDLKELNWGLITKSNINCILIHLNKIKASNIIEHCKKNNLYIRDVTGLGRSFGCEVIRIAIKDSETNKRILSILKSYPS